MNATGSVLVDTSAVVAHFRGDSGLAAHLRGTEALYVPWVVLGELHYGAHRARRREEGLTLIREFLRIAVVLLPDERTAELYGRIKAELAQAGTPIPDNDIWIAALTREYQLPLVTRDQHFSRVSGLATLDW